MTEEQFEALTNYIDVIAAKATGDLRHIGFSKYVEVCMVDDAKEKLRTAFFGSDAEAIEKARQLIALRKEVGV